MFNHIPSYVFFSVYAYKKNNKVKFICEDVAGYDFKSMKKMYSKDSIKILAGCAFVN
jgi:hypothetical protein